MDKDNQLIFEVYLREAAEDDSDSTDNDNYTGIRRYPDRATHHYENGSLVQVDYDNGDHVWYEKGKRHRKDGGPAAIWNTGEKFWYNHGKQSREDGPAVVHPNGDFEWWLDGYDFQDPRHWAAMVLKKRNQTITPETISNHLRAALQKEIKDLI